MKRAVQLLAIAVIAFGAFFAVYGSTSASHSWKGLHWARTSNPFTINLGDNVNGVWDGILTAVATDWSASDVLNTTKVASNKNPATCAPTNGRVEVCNSTYGQNGWLGMASVSYYLVSNHIIWGTVKLNDTYFNTSTYDNDSARRHVACQEVGHLLGLDHNRNGKRGGTPDDTCMNDQAGLFDANYVDPNSHDYAQLASIYAHVDSSSTIAAGAQGKGPAAALDALPPGAGPQDGNVFVRDLGNGVRLVTFVVWAD